jgi:predicted ATPase
VECARRAVALDPWSAAARRSLMEALSQGGDTNAALQVYREFLDVLRSDPKAVPDEKISALYQRLRKEARHRAVPAAVPETTALETIALGVTGYLPHPLTDLVGREEERLEAAARLRRSRLVTLTGPGGIGKTRLAIEVAAEAAPEFANGVWLEALAEGSQIERQVALVLGVKEIPGQPLRETLTGYLRSTRLLLVLDNCEHLLDASAKFAGHLLRECMGVRMLATSRAALGMTGETVWPVPALAVPDTDHLPTGRVTLTHVLMGYESVQLFVERAQAVQKTFVLTADSALPVAQICARPEGMPLAIELAAARVKSLTAAQIAVRLDDHLSLLTGGNRAASSRQQTLRATLDWSYALLTEEERLLLARLSVFAGGWSLDAAETVCSDKGIAAHQVLGLLTALVEKSLVVFEAGEIDGRYRLLETVRQYAADRLRSSGALTAVRAKHRDWCLELTHESVLSGAEVEASLRRLEAEHDNLRTALACCEEDELGAETGLELAKALWPFWHIRAYFSEGQQSLGRALARTEALGATPVRAEALRGMGSILYRLGEYTAASARHEESLEIQKRLGDKKGTASSLNSLGNIHLARSDYEKAKSMFAESLNIFQELGNRSHIAWSLFCLAHTAYLLGDYSAARPLFEESLSIRRALGNKDSIATSLLGLGDAVKVQGDYAAARAIFEECLSIFQELENKSGSALALLGLGSVANDQGEPDSARRLVEEGLSIFQELGEKKGLAEGLFELASALLALTEPQKAVCLWGAAESLRQTIGAPLLPLSMWRLRSWSGNAMNCPHSAPSCVSPAPPATRKTVPIKNGFIRHWMTKLDNGSRHCFGVRRGRREAYGIASSANPAAPPFHSSKRSWRTCTGCNNSMSPLVHSPTSPRSKSASSPPKPGRWIWPRSTTCPNASALP